MRRSLQFLTKREIKLDGGERRGGKKKRDETTIGNQLGKLIDGDLEVDIAQDYVPNSAILKVFNDTHRQNGHNTERLNDKISHAIDQIVKK